MTNLAINKKFEIAGSTVNSKTEISIANMSSNFAKTDTQENKPSIEDSYGIVSKNKYPSDEHKLGD